MEDVQKVFRSHFGNARDGRISRKALLTILLTLHPAFTVEQVEDLLDASGCGSSVCLDEFLTSIVGPGSSPPSKDVALDMALQESTMAPSPEVPALGIPSLDPRTAEDPGCPKTEAGHMAGTPTPKLEVRRPNGELLVVLPWRAGLTFGKLCETVAALEDVGEADVRLMLGHVEITEDVCFTQERNKAMAAGLLAATATATVDWERTKLEASELEGKGLLGLAKVRLPCDDYHLCVEAMTRLNSKEQTLERTIEEIRDICGQEHDDLSRDFENQLTRQVRIRGTVM
mmetsp:Transcript_44801/g.100613  ORF Transcript_44801/g.100613 Transcript_44801/m.100613 type:complete len:286 (+) Transcript_44801:92-949(+)